MLTTINVSRAAAVEDVPDLAPGDDVDARGRLVEHEQARLGEERVHDRELLLHAARERAGGAIAERRQAGALEERRRAGHELVLGEPVQAGREAQVLEHREIAMQAERLRHVADVLLQRRDVGRGEVVAEHGRRRRLDLEEADDRPQQRRLAGPVRPDDADDLRAADLEIDARERAPTSEVLHEPAQA